MATRRTASELAELASVLPPRTVRRVQRFINGAERMRSELGQLGELIGFADELERTPAMVEIAPGVFVQRPRTTIGKLAAVARATRSIGGRK